ncbi:hypothetical protein ACFRAE_02585 [Sphingobacterium sp. HJSM2_6]|uniref:hypothetical protein n=1 Tax=Sphingobacterium sp. HJSM2_6 TaxID=3366264 RepID=UPI003BD1CA5B
MLKIKLGFFLFFLNSLRVLYAQDVVFTLNGSTIQNNEQTKISTGNEINILLGFLSGGAVRANQNFFIKNNQNSFYPISNVTSTVEYANQVYNWFNLSNTDQVIVGYNAVTGANFNGYFNMHFRLNRIRNYAWLAGTYTADLYFRLVSINIFSYIRPDYKKLQINVPGFIDPYITYNQYHFTIDRLDYFRQGFESQLINNISAVHSLPFNFFQKAANNQFSYTKNSTTVNNSGSPISALQVKNTQPNNSNYIRMNTAYQQLGSRLVPVGNLTEYQQRFFISAEDLKRYFLNSGTYSNTLQYRLTSTNLDYPLTKDFPINLSIDVPDLSEMLVKEGQVDLSFDDRIDYQQGVSKEIKGHLTISKTSGFQVSVRANSPYFQMGTSRIPVNILSIGPAQGEQKVLPINAVSTTNQTLINSSQAVIDQQYDIKYSIALKHVPTFIGSTKGTYSTTLIYTLTAQ